MNLLNKYLTYIYRGRVAMLFDIALAGIFCVAVFYAHVFIKKIMNDELNS
jgi:hypothetical protein